MSIDQLDLILYDMYRMDAWLPPLFGKWAEDYKKASYSQWAVDELRDFIAEQIYPRREGSIDEFCPMIASYLDNRPCSVLEMLIALAFRCEEHIMTDPDIGNRMGQWFWNMIVSLGLGSMSDSRFDAAYTDDVISRFMNRKYKRNGEGGLFTVERCKYDMRTVEIWWQMNWYLDSIL